MSRKTMNTKGETEANAKELGNRKKFTPHDLVSFVPKTLNQDLFFKAYEKGTPVISLRGFAGVGKTAIAFYAGLTSVFDESSEFDRIVMVRSAVESRKMGFLPGSVDEKAEAYEAPYKALTEQFVTFKTAYQNMKALGYYDFITTSYLRGITLDNCVVIVEESQNLDYAELHTIMTRVGVNSRIIFTGDSRQDDLKRQREKSGFDKFHKVIAQMPKGYVDIIDFTVEDVVRSGVVKEFLIADHEFGED